MDLNLQYIVSVIWECMIRKDSSNFVCVTCSANRDLYRILFIPFHTAVSLFSSCFINVKRLQNNNTAAGYKRNMNSNRIYIATLCFYPFEPIILINWFIDKHLWLNRECWLRPFMQRILKTYIKCTLFLHVI